MKVLQHLSGNKKIGALSFVAVVVISGFIWNNNRTKTETVESQTQNTEITLATETLGQVQGAGTEESLASWPGEIISAGDIEVQPAREGSIVEWKVKIGQKVTQGQVLARLSAPPATPDVARTLAEQAQSFTKAKAAAEAQATFVEKNKLQLQTLRAQIIASGNQTASSLSSDPNSDRSRSIATLENSLQAARRDVDVKNAAVKDYSAQALRSIIKNFTNYSSDPITVYKQSPQNFFFYLKPGLGDSYYPSQTNFLQDFSAAVKAYVENDDATGEKTLKFLSSADALAANSYFVNGSEEELARLRALVSDQRSGLSEKTADLTEAKTEVSKIESEIAAKKSEFSLTAANSSKETAEKLKDIDEKLAELDRELALARADADAARVAYGTIAGALTGGLNITSPRAGIVSTILKKNGDFVSPGVAVASINSGNTNDRIVRFKIPGNAIPPLSGNELTVIRPGFPKDGKKIKVVGIGASLDGNGSFLADADFVEPVDWPVHGSVRVLATANNNSNLVSLSAVWWNEQGQSNVWLITEENRIRPQEVKTGRTLGDKIEILDGLQVGSNIVTNASPDLKTGTQLNKPAEKAPATEPAGDGHGHTHDE